MDVLGLPVKKPVAELNARIKKSCGERLDFGSSESRTEGTSITQRVVNNETGELVVNNTISGKLFLAASTILNGTDHKSARCKVIIYSDDKPMETINGMIECAFASSLPTAISEMLTVEAKPREEDLPIEESDRKQEEEPIQKPDGRWNILVLVAGTVCLVAVFVLRLVQVNKGNGK